MFFNDYQEAIKQFRLETYDYEAVLFGLGAETGEVLTIEQKHRRDGGDRNYREKMKKEIGDVLWHLATLASDNELSLNEIALENINKLRDRAERNVLQGSGDNR